MAWNISNILVNEAIANKKSGGSDLAGRVEALETTVGDSSSGLVKDVDDLETVVGNSSGGLVKEVSDLGTAITGVYPNVYSTDEVKIGSWLGNDLYRKVVSCGVMPNNTTKNVTTGLSNVSVVRIYGYGVNGSNSNVVPLPRVDSGNGNILVGYTAATGEITFRTADDLSYITDSYVVLEYIKNPEPEPENNTRKRGK